MRRIVLAVVVLCVAGSVEGQEPSFRTGVELLEIAVSVSDRSGSPMSDLTRDDFEVRIDGRARPVHTASHWSAGTDRLPLDACRLDPSADDVDSLATEQWSIATNRAGDGHRLVAVVLDDILTSPRRTMPVRRAARELVERRLADGDAVAVISTGGQEDIDASFTTARASALARIDRFFGQAQGPLVTGAHAALAVRRTMEVLDSLARLSQSLDGRPLTVVLFSEGIEFDIFDVRALDTNDVLQAIRTTMESLRAGNVVLYAVDPRGLVTPEDGLVERNTYRDDSVVGSVASATRMAALRRSLQSLRQMAEETGGFAAVDRNDFDSAFDRIVSETGSLYLLGVESVVARRGGSRIDVSVGRPGARVSARRRYVGSTVAASVAATRTRQDAVRALLASPTSRGALPLSAQVVPLEPNDHNARRALLLVEVEPSGFQTVERAGESVFVELAAIAMNDRGEPVGTTVGATATIRLGDDISSRLDTHGFRWLHEIDLPASAREVRIALDVSDGLSGVVVTPVAVVEPHGARGIAIGAIVMASINAAAAVTAGSASSLGFARGVPTTRRTFTGDDLVEFGVRVNPDDADVWDDALIVRLVSRVSRTRQVTLEPSRTPTSARPLHVGSMPLAGFPAGDHHVDVQVHAENGHDRVRLPLCVRPAKAPAR